MLRALILALLLTVLVSCNSGNNGGSSSAKAAPLGASQTVFTAALGQPNNHSAKDAPHYRRCSGKSLDEFIVGFTNDRAFVINHQACSGSQTSDSSMAQAQKFLPSDAQDRGTVHVPVTGESGHRYFSASVAAAIGGPELYDTCPGTAPAPAGTITLVFTSEGWDLVVGYGC